MKKIISLMISLIFLSCSSSPKKAIPNSIPDKEPPRVEVSIKENRLNQGLKALAERKVTALFIYNLPDSYLIKAKHLFNPPDYAAQEVINLQTDRQEWFDEMNVTYCEDCKNITVEIPYKVLPENILLSLIDRASLNQDFSVQDVEVLRPFFKDSDVFWVILGSEDYEQSRGETGDGVMISAMAENTVTLRSFIYDMKSKAILNRTVVTANDRDFVIYEKAMNSEHGKLTKKSKVLNEKMKDKFWPLPVGMAYDSPQFDESYPYPPVPESSYLIKKALSSLGEQLNP